MTTRTPEELEEKLHYHFKNKELLITALTHSSYANESKTPTLYNERLEFLGDSVLSVVVANSQPYNNSGSQDNRCTDRLSDSKIRRCDHSYTAAG